MSLNSTSLQLKVLFCKREFKLSTTKISEMSGIGLTETKLWDYGTLSVIGRSVAKSEQLTRKYTLVQLYNCTRSSFCETENTNEYKKIYISTRIQLFLQESGNCTQESPGNLSSILLISSTVYTH